MVIGLWGMMTQRNLIKIVIGFSIFDTGLNIAIVSMSYVKNSTAPIIDKAVDVTQAASKIADPVPQALSTHFNCNWARSNGTHASIRFTYVTGRKNRLILTHTPI